MQNQKLHFFTDKNLIFIPFLLLLFLIQTCQAADGDCRQPSSCGKIPIIRNPFRLTTDPETIRLVDDGVAKGNCSSLPRNALSENSFFFMSSYIATRDRKGFLAMLAREEHLNEVLTLISCRNPVRSAMYMETGDCIDGVGGNSSRYAVVGGGVNASSLEKMCRVDMMTMMAKKKKDYGKMPFREIHRQLEYGFELSWHLYECRLKGCLGVNSCYLDGYDNVRSDTRVFGCVFASMKGCGTPSYSSQVRDLCLPVFRFLSICSFLSGMVTSEILLFSAATLGRLVLTLGKLFSAVVLAHLFIPPLGAPLVCAFSEIKKVTRGFKDKLGEGGFGTVYKGKLRSGSFAAVKMLGKSAAGGGQDFMSEVATIGRIHHANVVRLIGFCSEGTKRALVYEFMPNGSLDKYIFHKQGYVSLSMEQLYHISLGVARGIEYLHSGCAMQILHFDIKPHNILLDEKFNPKVSDFGLAKLYQAGDRVATLTAARGTIGYMAPELFFAKKMVIVGLWCIQTNPRNRPPMNKVVEMLEGDAESLQLPPRPVLYD